MEEEKKNQWHPAFYGALHLELTDNKDDKNYADSVWEIVTSQNEAIIKKIWEDKQMCKAMAELFKSEIDAVFGGYKCVSLHT